MSPFTLRWWQILRVKDVAREDNLFQVCEYWLSVTVWNNRCPMTGEKGMDPEKTFVPTLEVSVHATVSARCLVAIPVNGFNFSVPKKSRQMQIRVLLVHRDVDRELFLVASNNIYMMRVSYDDCQYNLSEIWPTQRESDVSPVFWPKWDLVSVRQLILDPVLPFLQSEFRPTWTASDPHSGCLSLKVCARPLTRITRCVGTVNFKWKTSAGS